MKKLTFLFIVALCLTINFSCSNQMVEDNLVPVSSVNPDTGRDDPDTPDEVEFRVKEEKKSK